MLMNEESTKEVRRRRLIELLKEISSEMNQAQFCSRIGADPSLISQAKTGNRPLPEKWARRIEQIFNKPRLWMDGAQNQNYPDWGEWGSPEVKELDPMKSLYNVSEAPEIKRYRVPLISGVQAGKWTDIVDNFEPGDAEDWLPTTATVGPHAFALRVEGDSMTAPAGKSIPEGAIVIVDPEAYADNGSIVVAKMADSDRATLKKLVIDGPNRYLRPLNPDYAVIPINGNCHIVGVAKKVEFDL